MCESSDNAEQQQHIINTSAQKLGTN